MFYVYEHTRLDTGMVFYVGKGSGKRAYIHRGRNTYWHRIVSKAGGFKVSKIVENIDEELAFLVEQERIDQLKRLGIKLTNLTDGGEGGINPSQETRQKMSEARKGEKNPRFNVNSIRQKRIRGELKVPKEVMSANMKANHWSKTGKYTPKGLKRSEEARENMRLAHKAMLQKECPHCGYKGKPVTISRWHNDRCKLKGVIMSENTKKTQISIDGKDFFIEDMTDEQRTLVQHCLDLDRKIGSARFNLDQLQVGRDAFMNMLKQSLEAKPEVTDVEAK